MPASRFHQVIDIRGRSDFLSDYHRREDLFTGDPRRIGPFVGISGYLATGNFAPTLGTVGLFDADKNDPAFISAAKARLEKMYERQDYFSQFDLFDRKHKQ